MTTLSDDPCVAAQELRRIYQSVIIGGQPVTVEFWTDGGTRRRVEYGKTNASAILQEIGRLEGLCAIKTGKSGGRFVIRGG